MFDVTSVVLIVSDTKTCMTFAPLPKSVICTVCPIKFVRIFVNWFTFVKVRISEKYLCSDMLTLATSVSVTELATNLCKPLIAETKSFVDNVCEVYTCIALKPLEKSVIETVWPNVPRNIFVSGSHL